jgi:uncharacterized protein
VTASGEYGDGERGADRAYVLPERSRPVPDPAGVDGEYWTAIRGERLVIQRCRSCRNWQWGPEWSCYHCGSFDVGWEEIPKTGGRYRGVIYSWERVWHPTDTMLASAVPYLVLLVSLPAGGDIRMVGNYVGDQRRPMVIGDEVYAVFEHHDEYTLVHWRHPDGDDGETST